MHPALVAALLVLAVSSGTSGTSAAAHAPAAGTASSRPPAAAVLRELRWVRAHAHDHHWDSGHPYIPDEDCANFAGRALAVRGLPAAVLQTSSTALRRTLIGALHERELADSPAARRQVRVGDVVQFDWWPTPRLPGDRDHTGIVTSVARRAGGTVVVRYTAQTDPDDEPQLGQTIEGALHERGHDPHGRVFFLLIR